MAKKLSAVFSGITSEVAKDQAIAAVIGVVPGLTEGAAEILRDANGKVVEVRLTLADSVADAAKVAVNATPGVANVLLVDVPPGFLGYDGTAAGKATLISQGALVTVTDLDEVFNADGTVTYSNKSGTRQGKLEISLANTVPVHPLPWEAEYVVTYNTVTQVDQGSGTRMRVVNNGFQGDLDTTVFERFTVNDVSLVKTDAGGEGIIMGTVDTAKHVYTMKFDGTKLQGFIDGTLQATTANVVSGTFSNFINFNLELNRGLAANAALSMNLDFVRWSV